MRPSTRKLIAGAAFVAAAVVTVVPAGATPTVAAATNGTLASYCSPSHDVCLRIADRSGAVYFDSTFKHRFGRYYRLCVKPAGGGAAGLRRCGSYPLLRRASGSWGSSVNYTRTYPTSEAGWVGVTWSHQGRRLGPTLRFRLPR